MIESISSFPSWGRRDQANEPSQEGKAIKQGRKQNKKHWETSSFSNFVINLDFENNMATALAMATAFEFKKPTVYHHCIVFLYP